MYRSFVKITGSSGGLALVLSLAIRALNGMLFEELISWMDSSSGANQGWTSILGLGSCSGGSSEASVNQPHPNADVPSNPNVAGPSNPNRAEELGSM